MAQFRKKPVVVEAVQFIRMSANMTFEWSEPIKGTEFGDALDEVFGGDGGNGSLIIVTKEGDMTASPGDWIIRGVKGEFYPCKPDIFEATYESC